LITIIILLTGCTQSKTSSQTESFESLQASSETESAKSSSAVTSDLNIKSNDEYKYEIVDNSVTIVEYIGSAKDIVVPDTIDGYSVKVIGEYAFWGRHGIKSLQLPDSIEVIEKSAFEQTGIKKFVFPPKVTVISESVFYESELGSVVLPEHVKVIEGGAFGLTYITEIFIPDSVTTFDDGFYDCFRSLVILYDNNPLVPQHAKECNILCFKRSEYNPVMDVKLVGGKPLNDDKNLGISQNDYNRIDRQSMNDIEDKIQRGVIKANDYSAISFESGIYNAYSGFMNGDDLSQTAIQQKLTKLSTLLYQCGITEFDPKTVNTGEVGCFDKLVTAAMYCRWPKYSDDDVLDDCDVRFAEDDFLYSEALALFNITPDPSLVTGYSEQQHGIWYYPKELPEVTTEVNSFSGNLDDGNYVINIKFTDKSGSALERTFYFSIEQYDNVGGTYHRIILKGIQ